MKNTSISILTAAMIFLGLAVLPACKTSLESVVRKANEQLGTTTNQAPGTVDTVGALKDALGQGVNASINKLSQSGGFNSDDLVRIALPKDLQKAGDVLRKLGQDRYVDQFVNTMNTAAEKAVPQAAIIFKNSIREMSISDAIEIIKGPSNAATQYFRRTSESRLVNQFRPLVNNATDSVQLTQSYKKMLNKAGVLGQYVSKDAKDLDGYITQNAIDGLFVYIAQEEQKIRDNPLARSTELLKTVFGYYLD